MLIEQPPLLYRLLFPEAIWRIKKKKRRVVYLTFDDGPIPEVTPWVLDLLDAHGVKATFFLVGDNVRRSPHLLEEIKRRGIQDAMVTQTGCIGVCRLEPMVEVYMPGQEKVTYVLMTPEKVARVVGEHLINGKPVTEYTIGAVE